MRKRAAESSEQITQVLFGEHCEVTDGESEERWLKVKSLIDGYEGWVDRKMMTLIDADMARELSEKPQAVVNAPIAEARVRTSSQKILLTGGSRLPFYKSSSATATILDRVYAIDNTYVNLAGDAPYNVEQLIGLARRYMNAPYLWGGRNVMGIDCSGFVQTVFGIGGYRLTRDARTQCEEGTEVPLSGREAGDLAFFENSNGKIVHVGLVTDREHIVHASGRVKEERLTDEGIINEDTGMVSHQLRAIRRIV